MADTELQRLFSAGEAIEPDVAAELQSMMRLHAISAEDLFYKWESYCIKLDLDAADALTLANVRNLKQSIQDALEKASASTAQQGVSSATKAKPERKMAGTPRSGAGANGGAGAGAGGGGDMYGMLDGLMPSTPASGAKLNRGGAPGSAGGSALRRRMDSAKISSSPAGGLGEQLNDLSGGP